MHARNLLVAPTCVLLVLPYLQIIMDGNSRWATRQGLPAFVGHERGVAALKAAVITAREWGIAALTVRAATPTSCPWRGVSLLALAGLRTYVGASGQHKQ